MFGRESLRELIRNQHLEMREFLQDQREESRRWQEEREERYRAVAEEMREFNREILLRNEKVYTSVIATLEKQAQDIQENTERTKAGTQAILRLLDRFDEPGGAAA